MFELFERGLGVMADFFTHGLCGAAVWGSVSLPFESGDQNIEADAQHLVLSHQNIRGALSPRISILSQLTELNLSHNQITGTLPPEIGKIKPLKHLDVSNNQIVGPLPFEIGDLTQLEVFDASHNRLGTIDIDFSKTSFEKAHLPTAAKGSHRILDEYSIPSHMANMKRLRVLDLSHNQLRGPILHKIAHLKTLEVLNLSDNPLREGLTMRLGKLKRLEELYLKNCHIEGVAIFGIVDISSLRILDLSYNNLKGLVFSDTVEWKRLEVLDLSHNNMENPRWRDMRAMLGICTTQAQRDRIENPLLKAATEMTALRTLNLSYNELFGCIPQSIHELSHLEKLYLQHNELRGCLPNKMGRLQNLKHVDVSNNMLEGLVPESLEQLTQLETLFLDHNAFTGEFPPDLARTPRLKELSISANRFRHVRLNRPSRHPLLLLSAWENPLASFDLGEKNKTIALRYMYQPCSHTLRPLKGKFYASRMVLHLDPIVLSQKESAKSALTPFVTQPLLCAYQKADKTWVTEHNTSFSLGFQPMPKPHQITVPEYYAYPILHINKDQTNAPEFDVIDAPNFEKEDLIEHFNSVFRSIECNGEVQ